MKGPDDEAQKAYGRADHRDLEGARGRSEDGRRVPEARVSEATFYNWKAKYGGLEVSEAKRLKAMESENARLKKLLADAMLDNAALKDLLAKMYGPSRRCKVFEVLFGDSCVNVSGLSRVDCCCSQAVMRCARIVPNKWCGH